MAKRDPDKARYWERVFEEQAGSGQTIAAFCEERDLQRWKFYWWRRRLRENQASSDCPSISEEGFVELLGSSDRTEDGSSGITVKLDGRLSILLNRGFDPSTLKQVLSVVSERL